MSYFEHSNFWKKTSVPNRIKISSSIKYIGSLGPSKMRMGLRNMQAQMAALDNPQNQYPSVHIAGTNGKGSVAAITSSILIRAGYRVGMYTSPHLEKINERFQINGKPISDASIAQLTTTILRHSISRRLTHFEFLTAMAFLWFAIEKVDIAIIETGLGGRLDATNIIERPLVSVITNISLEHTQWLGKTVKKIAWEKAGIIKKTVPVITMAKGDALSVIKGQAKKNKSTVIRPQTYQISKRELNLKGDYQLNNARISLAILDQIKNQFPVGSSQIRMGFKRVKWPGRFEIFNKRRKIILDAGHNLDAFKCLRKNLLQHGFKKVDLLFGVLKDKDFNAMIGVISDMVNRVVVVPVPSERGADPIVIAKNKLWKGRAVRAPSILTGYRQLMKDKENFPILVTGSLFLVGAVRKILRK